MPAQAAGQTNVGAKGAQSASKNGPASNLRQRKSAGTKSAASSRAAAPAQMNDNSMWKFYTEDSPGIKVGPVPVLIMSLAFIASVFILHIWGKFTRSRAE
jgi:protein transport protein SEC61 subunit beta